MRLSRGFARGSIKVPQLRVPSLADQGRGPGGTRRGSSSALLLQVARFIAVGISCTVAYVVLYLLLRGVMSAQAANVISLLITAVANTAANRRLTFGISGRVNAARHQVKGLIAFGIGLVLTSGSLALLHSASRGLEVTVLIAANLVATVIRYVLYRTWVFGETPSNIDKSTNNGRHPIERDHVLAEAHDTHRPARQEPGPAPAARR
jgi:putative flippase GtrA